MEKPSAWATTSLLISSVVSLASVSCQGRTELWVEITSNIPVGTAGASGLESVVIELREASTQRVVSQQSHDLRAGRLVLPGYVRVTPDRADDPRPVLVRVTGQLSDSTTVKQEAIVSFGRGRRLLLSMDLSSACVGMASTVCESMGQTCREGLCVSRQRAELPEFTRDGDASVGDSASDSPGDVVQSDARPMGACTVSSVAMAAGMPVRMVWPPSGSRSTNVRPFFRWDPATSPEGALVEVCRDPACAMVIANFEVPAGISELLPSCTLSPGVVFWRVRARVGAGYAPGAARPWQTRLPEGPQASVSTAHGFDPDFNGDGFSDLAMLAVSGGSTPIATRVGSAGDLTGGGILRTTGLTQLTVAGDVDGDGYVDLVASTMSGNLQLFWGGPLGVDPSRSVTISGMSATDRIAAAGDFDGDGYSDVVIAQELTSPLVRHRFVVLLGTGTRANSLTIAREIGGGDKPARGATTRQGVWVAGAGDVNGDHRHDVAYSFVTDSSVLDEEVHVVRGAATGTGGDWMQPTLSTHRNFARGLQLGGDVTADGYADLVVSTETPSDGTPVGVGEVRIYRGSMGGIVTPTMPVLLMGMQTMSGLGAGFSVAGHLDSSGVGSMWIHEPGWQLMGVTAGRALRVQTVPGMMPMVVSADTRVGSATQIIQSMTYTGDQDGDGRDDRTEIYRNGARWVFKWVSSIDAHVVELEAILGATALQAPATSR
ncbi:MAG: VCBS repeat-containing protein [Deltaproteobacteria bacterium]|nr:VCBS repeat-containing protein [Deltaproteobacteria bacterium]